MATKSELIVRINADSKNLSNEYRKVAKETEALEGQISAATKVSAAALVGFAGAISLTVAKFREQEQAQIRTEATIKATGAAAGLTSQQIFKMASELQKVTTFGDEAILSGQNLLLTFKNIGGDVFPKATEIMLDMSVAMGTDLKSSAIQLGKALNDPTVGLTALSRVGITFSDQQKDLIKSMQKTGDIAGAQAIIMKELESQFGGTAKAATEGTGAFLQLQNVMGDFLEDIGKEFVPFLTKAAKVLSNFFGFIREHEVVARMAARTIALGAAISGLATALGLGALAFFKIRAAMAASAVATIGMKRAVQGLVGSTGLGLLIIVAAEVLANWETIFPILRDGFNAMADSIGKSIAIAKAAFGAFFDVIIGRASAFGDILVGVMTFDTEKIAKGMKEVERLNVEGFKSIRKAVDDEAAKQDAIIKVRVERRAEAGSAVADSAAGAAGVGALEAQTKAREEEIAGATRHEEKKTVIVDEATQKRIQIAKDELEVNKQLAANKNENNIAELDELAKQEADFLSKKLALKREFGAAKQIANEEERALALENLKLEQEELFAQEEEFREMKKEREAEIMEEEKIFQEELKALDAEERALLDEQKLNELRGRVETEKSIEKKAAADALKDRIDRNNLFLKEQQKYGTAYAKVNQVINSEEFKQAEKTANLLVQLSNGKNSTLKAIQKTFALSKIAIDTAQGAIAAYQAMAGIPFVGPALGVVAAGAVVAFGAQRANEVVAANQGGPITSPRGIRGVDNIPALLSEGELVVPARSFDETINAVANQRSGNNLGATGSNEMTSLLKSIDEKLDTRGDTFVFNGDVLADETFIDSMADMLRVGVEERNLRLPATELITS